MGSSARRAARFAFTVAMAFALVTPAGCAFLLSPNPIPYSRERDHHLEQGNYSLHRKDFEGAIASYRKALEVVDRYRRDGEKVGYHPPRVMEACIFERLGETHSRQRNHAEAAGAYQRALEIRETVDGPKTLAAAMLLTNLGYSYRMHGRYGEALASLERAARTYEERVDKGVKLWQALALNNIGHIHDAQGRPVEAESFFCRALALTEEAIGRSPQPDHGGYHQNILHLRDCAASVRKSGNLGEAEQIEKRLADMLRRVDDDIASLRTGGKEEQAAWLEAWYKQLDEQEGAPAPRTCKFYGVRYER